MAEEHDDVAARVGAAAHEAVAELETDAAPPRPKVDEETAARAAARRFFHLVVPVVVVVLAELVRALAAQPQPQPAEDPTVLLGAVLPPRCGSPIAPSVARPSDLRVAVVAPHGRRRGRRTLGQQHGGVLLKAPVRLFPIALFVVITPATPSARSTLAILLR